MIINSLDKPPVKFIVFYMLTLKKKRTIAISINTSMHFHPSKPIDIIDQNPTIISIRNARIRILYFITEYQIHLNIILPGKAPALYFQNRKVF
jgi:hypothetical protein